MNQSGIGLASYQKSGYLSFSTRVCPEEPSSELRGWDSPTQPELPKSWSPWRKRYKTNGWMPIGPCLVSFLSKGVDFHQQQWLERRHREGRRVGVIVFSCKGHIFLPGLSWQKPISKLDFLSTAMPYKDLAERLINILGELPIEDQVS